MAPGRRALAAALAALGALRGSLAGDGGSAGPPRLVVVRASPAKALGGRAQVGLLAEFSPPLPMRPATGGGAGANPLFAAVPATDPLGCSEQPPPRPPGSGPFVVIARRGNCSFVEKAQLARAAGAGGIVVMGDNESVLAMGGDAPPGGVGIFTLGVQKSAGEAMLSWAEAHHGKEPLSLSFELYKHSEISLSEAVLVLFATSLVAAGGMISTSDLHAGSPFAPQQSERITEIDNKMALGFCVCGSLMLMVLYFLMKYLIYLLIFGFCMGSTGTYVEIGSLSLQHFVPSLRQRTIEVGRCALRVADMIAVVPSVAMGVCWLVYRDTAAGWFFQDFMGFGFLCWIQRTLRLPNLKVATLFLSVMFCFDIFWVFLSPLIFGKSVMVQVATGVPKGETVPLLFRIPDFGDPFGGERMLGFGDIVLPGLLVSYARRYDVLSRRRLRSGYFVPALAGYFFGLCATLVALELMQMGQPALLYLVPGTLGTTLLLATRRGELGHLWHAVPAIGGAAGSAGAPGGDLQESLATAAAGTLEIAARVNDEGFCVRLGTYECFQDKYYCGRVLGVEAIPGSDGQCGPNDGPQCASCLRFQEALEQAALAPAPAAAPAVGP